MKIVKLLSYNIGVFLILLLIIEVVVRMLKPNYVFYERTYPGQYEDRPQTDATWLQKDEMLGWVCRTDRPIQFPNPHYKDKKVTYMINPQGFRSSYDFDNLPAKGEKKRVMLLGDSFLFSLYLHESETIETKLTNKIGDQYEFITIAIPGWGLDQMFRGYEKYVSTVNPDEVWLFYIDDDIFRCAEAYRKSEGMNKVRYKIINDELYAIKAQEGKPGFGKYLYQNSVILNRVYKFLSRNEGKRIVSLIFKEMIDDTYPLKKVIRMPYDFISGEPEWFSFQSIFQDTAVQYTELFDFMNELNDEEIKRLYLENDGHFNSHGVDFLVKHIID